MEARVHRLIRQADRARDARDWAEAALGYAAALQIDPSLAHIHVQHGHMLREAGEWTAAGQAYARALDRRPADGDAALYRSEIAIQAGELRPAIEALAGVLRRDPAHDAVRRALDAIMDAGHPLPTDRLLAKLGNASDPGTSNGVPAPGDMSDGPQLVLDLTELIDHYRRNRLPNGIQRVQTELLSVMLGGGDPFAACCFARNRQDWIELPADLCRSLVRVSGDGHDMDDPEWQDLRIRLFAHLAFAPAYEMPFGATLLNLGTPYWLHDYFRLVRNAKRDRQVRYVPLVYDLIPVVRPQYCASGWIDDFTFWLIGAVGHADGYLAISRSAKHDFLAAAAELGQDIPDDRVVVVPLDADFLAAHRSERAEPVPSARRHQTPFALMVATIEPRKNHALALDSWTELLLRHGRTAIPRLCCVGRDGWMNDAVYDRLDSDPGLADHVDLLYQVTDADLTELYRSCIFTVFPSRYEGWGLPVTESLCHGRVPVIADNSSLPEAGQSLALAFADGSVSACVAALERIIFDPAWRADREALIKEGFRPRTWSEIAAQIRDTAGSLVAGRLARTPVFAPEMGVYYPLGFFTGRELWRGLASGEAARIGEGWQAPDDQGCAILAAGGDLCLQPPEAGSPVLYVHVGGLRTEDCWVTISGVDGTEIGRALVRSNKTRWVECALPPGIAPALQLRITADRTQSRVADKGGWRRSSVVVRGLIFVDRSDPAATASFMDARWTDLASISNYTSPERRAEAARLRASSRTDASIS